jgi:hypothetical protein
VQREWEQHQRAERYWAEQAARLISGKRPEEAQQLGGQGQQQQLKRVMLGFCQQPWQLPHALRLAARYACLRNLYVDFAACDWQPLEPLHFDAAVAALLEGPAAASLERLQLNTADHLEPRVAQLAPLLLDARLAKLRSLVVMGVSFAGELPEDCVPGEGAFAKAAERVLVAAGLELEGSFAECVEGEDFIREHEVHGVVGLVGVRRGRAVEVLLGVSLDWLPALA